MLPQDDVETIGTLCKRIRLSRQLRRADIVPQFVRSMPTVTRIENGNGASRESFGQYVQALQSEKAASPLSTRQAEHLMQLYDLSRPQKVLQLEAEIAALSFCDVKRTRSQYNPQFERLLDAFQAQNRPALICDDLWFDHAINGALLQIFDVDPDSDHLCRWEAWHSLATKLLEISPVLDAQDISDYAFPLNVQLFHRHANRYLFTTQMRHLLNRLSVLSRENGLQFERCWHQTTTYGYSYSPQVLSNLPRRYVTDDEQKLHVEIQVEGTYPVTYLNGTTVSYRIIIWNPTPGRGYTEDRFRQVRQSNNSRTIYYAADYDSENSFHVNSWPCVQEHLAETLGC